MDPITAASNAIREKARSWRGWGVTRVGKGGKGDG
jgi:hypothetical protein